MSRHDSIEKKEEESSRLVNNFNQGFPISDVETDIRFKIGKTHMSRARFRGAYMQADAAPGFIHQQNQQLIFCLKSDFTTGTWGTELLAGCNWHKIGVAVA